MLLGGFRQVTESPWLVLGGGGLKGLAHVGAWRALTEAGVRPQGIVGTSIGALVGALASSGMEPAEMRRHALELEQLDIARVNRRVAWINGLRQTSVYRGDVLREYFERLLPDAGWEALRIPLLVNAVDLADGSTEWFGSGARRDVSLLDAVYASAALPVLYPPLEVDGRVFVDGGAAHQLALHRAAEEGACRIVGIDVGAGERGNPEAVLRQGLVAIHQRVFSIMTFRRRQEQLDRWSGPPLLYVRPRLDGYTAFDFGSVEYFLDEGYRAMGAALAAGLADPRTGG